MKILCLSFLLISSLSYANARQPNSVEYTCESKWKTLVEDLPAKKFQWRENVTEKVAEGLSFTMSSDDSIVKISVTERYKNGPENFVEYSFSCDKSLNCKGKQSRRYQGKTSSRAMDISPSGTIGKGSIDGKEYFLYKKLTDTKFEYQYVVYTGEGNEPFGLKVVCHE